jgi:hypothetical protein
MVSNKCGGEKMFCLTCGLEYFSESCCPRCNKRGLKCLQIFKE